MMAVIKKELRSFHRSISTYFFIAVSLLIGAFYFSRPMLSAQSYTFVSAYQDINILIPIFLPLLTMDSFALERATQTDKILLTGRTGIFAVVTGKFLSVSLIYSFTMSIVYAFPVLYAWLGNNPVGDVLLMYIGQLLFGMVIIAFGIFLSSMSSHPSRAGVVTIASVLLWWMLSNVLPNIQNKVLQNLVSFLSLFTYLDTFSHGLLSPSSVCTLLSFCVVFIFFATTSLQMWRTSKNG